MMHLSKFNTLENKLIKLKSRFVLLDKDEELELMVSQNATPLGAYKPYPSSTRAAYTV